MGVLSSGDVAGALQPVEHGRGGRRTQVDGRTKVTWSHPVSAIGLVHDHCQGVEVGPVKSVRLAHGGDVGVHGDRVGPKRLHERGSGRGVS